MDTIWQDTLRSIVLGQAAIVFILTMTVLNRFSKVRYLRRDRRKYIPLHFALISVSYFLATVFICFVVIERFGLSNAWPAVVAFIIFLSGDLALWFLNESLKDQLERKF